MLHDTVKNPQNSSASYNELVMKCIWKIIKDFQVWGDGLSYDLVFKCIHKFLEVSFTMSLKTVLYNISIFEPFYLLKLGI